MFLTVPWGIFIFGKIAQCVFCIFKSNYIVSYNSFSINREKLGDYLKWTDYSMVFESSNANLHRDVERASKTNKKTDSGAKRAYKWSKLEDKAVRYDLWILKWLILPTE